MGLIVALVTVALGGLVALQASLLNNAMELKERAFRRNVLAAMGQVSHALATGEALIYVLASDSAHKFSVETHVSGGVPESGDRLRDSMGTIGSNSLDSALRQILYENRRHPDSLHRRSGRLMLRVTQTVDGIDTVLIDPAHLTADVTMETGWQSSERGYAWEFTLDSTGSRVRVAHPGNRAVAGGVRIGQAAYDHGDL